MYTEHLTKTSTVGMRDGSRDKIHEKRRGDNLVIFIFTLHMHRTLHIASVYYFCLINLRFCFYPYLFIIPFPLLCCCTFVLHVSNRIFLLRGSIQILVKHVWAWRCNLKRFLFHHQGATNQNSLDSDCLCKSITWVTPWPWVCTPHMRPGAFWTISEGFHCACMKAEFD